MNIRGKRTGKDPPFAKDNYYNRIVYGAMVLLDLHFHNTIVKNLAP